jgi:hypothetical protein
LWNQQSPLKVFANSPRQGVKATLTGGEGFAYIAPQGPIKDLADLCSILTAFSCSVIQQTADGPAGAGLAANQNPGTYFALGFCIDPPTVSILSIANSSPERLPKPFIILEFLLCQRLAVEVGKGETPATGQEQMRDTRERIRAVIVRARNVIDTVFPGRSAPTLQAAKLPQQRGVVGNLYPRPVHERDETQVELTAVSVGGLVIDAVRAELLARPFTRVAIT